MKNVSNLSVMGLASLISFSLFGCGAGSDNSTIVQHESDALSYTYTMGGCSTGTQSFTSQAAFCAGLKDETLNHSCARDLRKQTYTAQCGNDFPDLSTPQTQPTNQPQPAETSQPQTQPTSTLPAPVPAPQPPTDNQPQVVHDLTAAGITVEVGETVAQLAADRLTLFWKELAIAKQSLTDHKDLFENVRVELFASYASAYHDLTLTVDFKAPDIVEYVEILNQRAKIEKAHAMTFDLGIDVYGHETPLLQSALERNQYFLNHDALLKSLEGFALSIKFADASRYVLSSGELQIDSNNYARDLGVYAQHLTSVPAVTDFFVWLRQSTITIIGTFEIESNWDRSTMLFSQLDSEIGDLSYLVKAGVLASIEIDDSSPDFLYSTLGIQLATNSATTVLNGKLIAALRIRTEASTLLAPIDVGIDSGLMLDYANYLQVVDNLHLNFALIQSKAKSIARIYLSKEPTSFRYGTLTIGSTQSAEDVAKVISQIP